MRKYGHRPPGDVDDFSTAFRKVRNSNNNSNRIFQTNSKKKVSLAESVHGSGSYLYREWQKPAIDDFSLEEFNEKIIQFGYIVVSV